MQIFLQRNFLRGGRVGRQREKKPAGRAVGRALAGGLCEKALAGEFFS
jgi:hypothetical protein